MLPVLDHPAAHIAQKGGYSLNRRAIVGNQNLAITMWAAADTNQRDMKFRSNGTRHSALYHLTNDRETSRGLKCERILEQNILLLLTAPELAVAPELMELLWQ